MTAAAGCLRLRLIDDQYMVGIAGRGEAVEFRIDASRAREAFAPNELERPAAQPASLGPAPTKE